MNNVPADVLRMEPSCWSKYRQAFSDEGPTSDDRQIVRYARVNRAIAIVVEALGIGAVFGYAASLYNDPNRTEGSLPPLFYGAVVTGGAAFGTVTVLKVRRFWQGKDDHKTWVTDPSLTGLAASAGPIVSLYLSQRAVAKLIEEIMAYNANATPFYEERSKLQDICYQNVYEGRKEFTKAGCSICVFDVQQYPAQFYQAYNVEGFQELVCYPRDRYLQSIWGNMGNFSSNSSTGEWPCGGEVFNSTQNEYDITTLFSHLLGVHPPMDLYVEPFNESCFNVSGSGTKFAFPSSDLCFSFGSHFKGNLSESVCGTPEWTSYAEIYSRSLEGTPLVFQYKSFPASIMHDGSTMTWQLGIYSTGMFLAVISAVARICFRRCQRAPRVDAVELETLKSEDEIGQAPI